MLKITFGTTNYLLDRGGVTGEGHRHFQALRGDVADGRLDVVRDPLDEIRRVFILDIRRPLRGAYGLWKGLSYRAARAASCKLFTSCAPLQQLITQFIFAERAVPLGMEQDT